MQSVILFSSFIFLQLAYKIVCLKNLCNLLLISKGFTVPCYTPTLGGCPIYLTLSACLHLSCCQHHGSLIFSSHLKSRVLMLGLVCGEVPALLLLLGDLHQRQSKRQSLHERWYRRGYVLFHHLVSRKEAHGVIG